MKRTNAARRLLARGSVWCGKLGAGTNSGGFFVKRPNMQSPWRKGPDSLLNGANVIWRSSATTTHNVHQALWCKLMQ
jgi:hypothetical protein